MAKITFEGRPSIKGVLYNIDDSGIYIYSDRTNLPGDSLVNQAAATVYIPAIGIKQIFIRRRGGVGRGALIGAGIGLPVGIAGDGLMYITLSAVASSSIFGGEKQTITTFPISTISCMAWALVSVLWQVAPLSALE